MNLQELPPKKTLTPPKSAKASRKNLHFSPMLAKPITPFQNGV